jgi:Xaa-Pro aminopeptidase
LTDGLREHLGADVRIEKPDAFPAALDALGRSGKPVRIDPAESAYWILERLQKAGVKLDKGDDPCVLPKACKNAVELDGIRAAHRRDGAALARFLAWLDLNAMAGDVTELSAEEKLASFRAANNLYAGPSFDTIAGAGSHGAIVHYRATKTTNRRLESGQLFLLDSGGQYLDGTTDVTRTIALGPTDAETRDRFTRVLKGHIALASIRFPEGTTGAELDILARQYLWAAGLDYSHGTGHGVGAYLGVHEGPQGISRRSKVALLAGMVVSNEPGYYKSGAYGIRIENLQVVTAAADIPNGERPMMGFDPLTLVPIDRRLIDPALLTAPERAWLNAYHTRVRDTLKPMVDSTTAEWLDAVTAEI